MAITIAGRDYICVNARGTLVRRFPKVRGKAAVKAAKRARQAARRRGAA